MFHLVGMLYGGHLDLIGDGLNGWYQYDEHLLVLMRKSVIFKNKKQNKIKNDLKIIIKINN